MTKGRSIAAAVLAAALPAGAARADLLLNAFNSTVTVDFNSFAGTGFTTAPAAGQLDSNTWRVTGMSDGAGTFGGTHTTGDFARGSSLGGVTTGGTYAFQVATGDFALGAQPAAADFTPGEFTLRVQNNTGSTITQIDLEYDIYVFNDQGRGNSFNFDWSLDDVAYTDIAALDFVSPDAADVTPVWTATARSTSITGLSLAAGGVIYLRWTSDDVSGAGSRDELALDNVAVTAIPAPGALVVLGLAGLGCRRRRR
jgi:hypothetical protein